MKITNIYRYPIKSFSKEEKNEVEITDFNRIVGDRIAAFKIGENTKNYEWLPKKNYLSLMHVPNISKIKIKYIDSINKLSIKIPDRKEFLVNSSIISVFSSSSSAVFRIKILTKSSSSFLSLCKSKIGLFSSSSGLICLMVLSTIEHIRSISSSQKMLLFSK